MDLRLFWAPAAIVVAVLTLMVVPFLSLIAFVIGPLAAAIAPRGGRGEVVAARFGRRSNRQRDRARAVTVG